MANSALSYSSLNNQVITPAPVSQSYGVNFSDLLGISNSNSALSESYAQNARNWSEKMQENAMEYNAFEAERNRLWQEFMSNTAHQREVQDLVKAGLNPVLSAGGGNGASVGSGSQASVAIPSASSGSVDTSGSAAIVNLLTTLLMAQTNILNTSVSANATMNAASLTSAASKYSADQARLNAITAADASRYAADASKEASKYSADKNYRGTVETGYNKDGFLGFMNWIMNPNSNINFYG